MVSEWPTEAEAAALLGVSVKTIGRYAAKGMVEMRKRHRIGKKAENICNPRDLERLKPAAQAIVETAPPAPIPAPPVVQKDAGFPSGFAPLAPALRTLIQTISTALQDVQIERSRKEKLWLTIEEAAAYSGRSKSWLLQACKEGKLVAEKDRGWRIRRASLEAYLPTGEILNRMPRGKAGASAASSGEVEPPSS